MSENNIQSYSVPLSVACIQLCWMIAFPFIAPGSTIQYPFFVYGAVPTLSTLILLYWFLSRTPRSRSYQRLVITVFAVVVFTQVTLLHWSLQLVRVFVFQPMLTSAIVFTMVAARRRPPRSQLGAVVLVLLVLNCSTCALRMQGMTGDLMPTFAWRWQLMREQRLTHSPRVSDVAASADLPIDAGAHDWPTFRGPRRDGVVRNSRLSTDWNRSPPKEVWANRHRSGLVVVFRGR